MKIRNGLALTALAGLLVFSSLGAATADHPEAQRPIVGMELNLYQYPDKAGTLLEACDGTEVFSVQNMRIEIDAILDNGPEWRGSGDPSEHYDVDITVRAPFPGRGGREIQRVLWSTNWDHENAPPHQGLRGPFQGGTPPSDGSTDGGRHEVTQSVQWNMQRLGLWGTWTITASVEGNESGNDWEVSCDFLVLEDN